MDRAQATVGDNLKVTLSFIRQDNTDNSITYLVKFSILTYHTHQLSQVTKQDTTIYRNDLWNWGGHTSFPGPNIAWIKCHIIIITSDLKVCRGSPSIFPLKGGSPSWLTAFSFWSCHTIVAVRCDKYKCWMFSDPEQRSVSEAWPLQEKRANADILDNPCYRKHDAIVPPHSLLLPEWQWSGVGLCLGRCWGLLHGLGMTQDKALLLLLWQILLLLHHFI